jgi:hypothetical protein
MDNLSTTNIYITAAIIGVIFIILFRLAYLENHIDYMKHQMAKYGSFLYLKLCTQAQKELIYQESPDSYEEFMVMMHDIDNNSRKIVDKVQQGFIPNKKLLLSYFFKTITYADLYIEPNYVVIEFIPEQFPTEWEVKQWEKLNGFYNGVTAMQISRVKEMEHIILESMKREI